MGKRCRKFLEDTFDEISVEVENLLDFKEEVKKKKTVGLYMGRENKNFVFYYKFAESQISLHNYHSFNRSLNQEIMRQYGIKIQLKDIYVVINSKEKVTDYD